MNIKPEDQYQVGDHVLHIPSGVYATIDGYVWLNQIGKSAAIIAYRLSVGINASFDEIKKTTARKD